MSIPENEQGNPLAHLCVFLFGVALAVVVTAAVLWSWFQPINPLAYATTAHLPSTIPLIELGVVFALWALVWMGLDSL